MYILINVVFSCHALLKLSIQRDTDTRFDKVSRVRILYLRIDASIAYQAAVLVVDLRPPVKSFTFSTLDSRASQSLDWLRG